MTENTLNILVVDDDEVVREQLRRYLSKSNQAYNLIEAVSKQAGKERLLEGNLDCAMVDFHMGDGDAFSLIAELRAEQPEFATPLVLLTGLGSEEIAVKAIKLGINYYINKDNLSKELLENSIRTAVAEQKLASAEKAHRKALEHLSMHDELTGLPNRRLLMERLSQRILMSDRNAEPFALMMIDLDRFKSINDTQGHLVGDEVLRIIGARLQHIARRSDTYARLGGDEFAVLLSSAQSIEGAITVAGKVAAAIQQPISANGRILQTDASIGIAMYPDHGTEATELISHADDAMYQSKQSVDDYRIYISNNDQPLEESAKISLHLKSLSQAAGFKLFYQPQFNLQSGELVGAEALSRWHHPQLGEISPGKLVPILERSKFILEFTNAVVEKAVRQIAAWASLGLDLPVSVNISPQALTAPSFFNHIKTQLAIHQICPSKLTLEITETTSLSNYDSAATVLIALADFGVGISIDDFGTGYTSIRYLREFPAKKLKIDQLFIRELAEGGRDYSIISGIIRLAKGIGAYTVAEGIEDAETLKILLDLGCDVGQGYYLGYPTGAENFTRNADGQILCFPKTERDYLPASQVVRVHQNEHKKNSDAA